MYIRGLVISICPQLYTHTTVQQQHAIYDMKKKRMLIFFLNLLFSWYKSRNKKCVGRMAKYEAKGEKKKGPG
jgi:hypothetical protein